MGPLGGMSLLSYIIFIKSYMDTMNPSTDNKTLIPDHDYMYETFKYSNFHGRSL